MLESNYQTTAQEVYGGRIRVRVCGVCIENEHILLACHRPILGEKDYWCPPGGGVDVGETAEIALKREFLEETGLSVEVGRLLFTREFVRLPLHAIELYFEVKIVGGKLTTGYDPELATEHQMIKEVVWKPLENKLFSLDGLDLGINT